MMPTHPPEGWQDSYGRRLPRPESKPESKPESLLKEVRAELRAMAYDAIRSRQSMMVSPHRVLEVLDALDALAGE